MSVNSSPAASFDIRTLMRRATITRKSDIASIERHLADTTHCFKARVPFVRSLANIGEQVGDLTDVGVARLEKIFGDGDFATVLEYLDERLEPLPSHPLAIPSIDFRLLRTLEKSGGRELDQFVKAARVPHTLPVVESLLESHKALVRRPWEDCVLIACQHLLGSIVPQFLAFERMGIPPSQQVIVGKPYSSNRFVSLELVRRGFRVSSDSLPGFEVDAVASSFHYESYMTAQLSSALYDALQIVRRVRARQLLVLDDGGLLTRLVARDRHAAGLEVVSIEQTTGGVFRWRREQARSNPSSRVRLINVAECSGKLVRESPWIGDSLVSEMSSRLRFFNGKRKKIDQKRFGIIGYGTVGSSLASRLRQQNATVAVFDIDRHKLSIAANSGFSVHKSFAPAFSELDVLVGCTGSTLGSAIVDDAGLAALRDGAILASGSSGNTEWRRALQYVARPRRWSWSQAWDRDSAFDKIHMDYNVDLPTGQAVVLVNGGFPLNFNGQVDPIDPRKIQLTRALMVAAGLQAKAYFGGTVGTKLDEAEFPQPDRDSVVDLVDVLDEEVVDTFDVAGGQEA